ncbi:hypothetical protein BO71DRAFT_403257 [Aspergillus ellipticus CBS 707.79]|uniref:Uncharacterized protein n=1 Tax=Aspergillus ellipticus CBS 707.79 TaxID=1448320 RepID=A0A319CVU5_9EURO|nr:hypothetical protein BO71DRAFT_403257 [Aspergillus ellipticus CBS 707.79]
MVSFYQLSALDRAKEFIQMAVENGTDLCSVENRLISLRMMQPFPGYNIPITNVAA